DGTSCGVVYQYISKPLNMLKMINTHMRTLPASRCTPVRFDRRRLPLRKSGLTTVEIFIDFHAVFIKQDFRLTTVCSVQFGQ
ncbi:MAG TPA: hypothetical protein PL166_15555, partial [Candidatus Contendobacter sp.]|nr:hypothetical protein [Candidatus Contendobacter sp.]